MNLTSLREEVYEANLELLRKGLVLYTFGNASGIDRLAGLVLIKPSGVDYGRMTPADMVPVRLDTGEALPGPDGLYPIAVPGNNWKIHV